MMYTPPRAQRPYPRRRKATIAEKLCFADWRVPVLRIRWTRRKTYITIGIILGLNVLFQLVYPSDRLLPNARIDGVSLGWQTMPEATETLNQAYQEHSVKLVGDGTTIASPTIEQLAITVDNTDRLAQAQYPLLWRIMPLSSFWWQPDVPSSPKLITTTRTEQYITQTIMPVCKRAPVDASLKVEHGKLVVNQARRGGECQRDAVSHSIGAISPRLVQGTTVEIPMRGIAPAITTDAAKALEQKITKVIGKGVALKVKDETVTLPANEVIQWVVTQPKDKTLVASISASQASGYLTKHVTPKVNIDPGTTKVATYDLTETSRTDGKPGRTLDIDATAQQLTEFINQTRPQPAAVTKTVPAKVEYDRNYSSTEDGLNALLKHYAEDHPGTYGVSFLEIDGKKRNASYNGNKQFVTASTYKLFVGYSVLRREQLAGWRWEDNQVCFNKMISQSDNPCAENYLKVIGYDVVTKDANDIGFKDTTFAKSGGPYTTANDLARFMVMLDAGQNFSSANRDRFLSALKANVYRKGIPAGTNGTVANKVGFLNGLLHDAAIVYDSNGKDVLAIMTDGSSWNNIAELTKRIEQFRSQP